MPVPAAMPRTGDAGRRGGAKRWEGRRSGAGGRALTYMVELNGVEKRFGDVEAVRGLTLSIRQGEIFGLLGPNGAGKTTTIRLLMGLERPTAGTVRIAGMTYRANAAAIRRLVGWVPQAPALDPLLTGRELLRMVAELYNLPNPRSRVEEALERFSLMAAADRLVRDYSGGMKKRLELAAGTLHRPQLLVLDEPTAGLDVDSRHQLWELIRTLNAEGTTVVVTTHYLEEADMLCHRVAVVDRGRLRALGSPAELKARYGTARIRLTWPDADTLARAARICRSVLDDPAVRETGNRIEISTADPAGTLLRLVPAFEAGDLPAPGAIETLNPTLDQVFARVTGRAVDPVTGAALGLPGGFDRAPEPRDLRRLIALLLRDHGERVERPGVRDMLDHLPEHGLRLVVPAELRQHQAVRQIPQALILQQFQRLFAPAEGPGQVAPGPRAGEFTKAPELACRLRLFAQAGEQRQGLRPVSQAHQGLGCHRTEPGRIAELPEGALGHLQRLFVASQPQEQPAEVVLQGGGVGGERALAQEGERPVLPAHRLVPLGQPRHRV